MKFKKQKKDKKVRLAMCHVLHILLKRCGALEDPARTRLQHADTKTKLEDTLRLA